MYYKFIVFLFLIFTFLSLNLARADESHISSDMFKKYNLSICTVFKNEANYLKEWIEYHRILGVDHFYLYDIGSSDYSPVILREYINEGLVTLVNWPDALAYQTDGMKDAYKWALSTQIPAYENAVNFLAREETKWLAFVDMDEFLVCLEGDINELLYKYNDYSGIALSSEFFDAAILKTQSKNKRLIQGSGTAPLFPTVVNHSIVKMIFKPDQCMGFNWPPYQCRFKPLQSSTMASPQELRIHRYLNRNVKDIFFEENSPSNQVEYSILPKTDAFELLEKYINENLCRPMYEQEPEFLRKLKHDFELETSIFPDK